MRKSGFTLVEVLVVLTIVSLVVGSITYVAFNTRQDIQSVSREIVQSIKLIQQRSIRDDKPYQIEIDISENSISFEESKVDIPKNISLTVKTAASQIIDEDVVGMTFYPDASSTGGAIVLESGDEVYEITVVWISGKIMTQYSVQSS
jgi:prepilin-type N-terminal cleavage/methylation domain-containing protein